MSSKSANAYTVAKPFHFVSKVFGLTSFTVAHENGKFITSTSVFNIFCILSSTVCCIVGSFYFHEFMYLVRERFSKYEISNTIEKSSIVLTIFYVYSLIFVNWWIFCSQRFFGKIFNALAEVDDELKAMNTACNFNKQRRIVISVLIMAAIPVMYHIAGSFAMILIMDEHWIGAAIFAMWIYMTAMGYTLFQFAFFMWQVKIRYQRINSYIVNLHSTRNYGHTKASDPLKVAAILHDNLVDISQLVNRCYGLPVSFIVKQKDNNIFIQNTGIDVNFYSSRIFHNKHLRNLQATG